jgi:hypothetical protein
MHATRAITRIRVPIIFFFFVVRNKISSIEELLRHIAVTTQRQLMRYARTTCPGGCHSVPRTYRLPTCHRGFLPDVKEHLVVQDFTSESYIHVRFISELPTTERYYANKTPKI